MSVFAQAAKIIGTLTGLAGLGQQGAGLGLGLSGITGGDLSAEYIAGSATSAGGDLGGIAAQLGKGPLVNRFDAYIKGDPIRNMKFTERMSGNRLASVENAKKGVKDIGKGVSIILWTITIVELLELTTGFGPPDEGGDLKVGSQQLNTLAAQLKSALPDETWQGSGSEAYADLDAALQNMATTMAQLDNQLAALVADQAEWVVHMRLAFGILKDVLFAAFVIEMLIFMIPPGGPLAAKIFAGTVCALGISAALSFLGVLLNYSITNGQKADALATRYTALAAGAVQQGSLAQATVATAEQSTVSSFDAISANMSGMSALSGMPAVASLTGAASGSEDQRAPLSAEMSASETPADGTPDAPETPDMTTPSTMPTLAQVSAMSGQTSKLSGQLSQHANLVNQAVGQMQQLAQMGRQGQGDAAPAEEAALAGGVEGAGATEGAGRAPIEVAASGAQAAQQPSGARRVA